MNSLNYPLDKFLPAAGIGKSLIEQYQTIMDIMEEHKPEMCLKLITDTDDLEEFHHVLWDTPSFTKGIYKISSKKGLLKSEDVYVGVIESLTYSLELFNLLKYTLTKTAFKGSWQVSKSVVSIRSDEFDTLFEEMMKSKPISYEDLPEGIKRNI
jgi:hypothetical protein